MLLIMMTVLTDDQSELVSQMYKEYYGLFYSIAYNILRSKTAAEDAVHTTFEKISRKIDEISQIPCPQRRNYCIVIIERNALAMVRSEKRIDYVESIDDDIMADEPTPEEITISLMEQENMKELFDKLEDKDQEILKLHFYNELSYKQIAELYEITVEAAKKRGQRALGELRALLK